MVPGLELELENHLPEPSQLAVVVLVHQANQSREVGGSPAQSVVVSSEPRKTVEELRTRAAKLEAEARQRNLCRSAINVLSVHGLWQALFAPDRL
jgi:hypothetical protein